MVILALGKPHRKRLLGASRRLLRGSRRISVRGITHVLVVHLLLGIHIGRREPILQLRLLTHFGDRRQPLPALKRRERQTITRTPPLLRRRRLLFIAHLRCLQWLILINRLQRGGTPGRSRLLRALAVLHQQIAKQSRPLLDVLDAILVHLQRVLGAIVAGGRLGLPEAGLFEDVELDGGGGFRRGLRHGGRGGERGPLAEGLGGRGVGPFEAALGEFGLGELHVAGVGLEGEGVVEHGFDVGEGHLGVDGGRGRGVLLLVEFFLALLRVVGMLARIVVVVVQAVPRGFQGVRLVGLVEQIGALEGETPRKWSVAQRRPCHGRGRLSHGHFETLGLVFLQNRRFGLVNDVLGCGRRYGLERSGRFLCRLFFERNFSLIMKDNKGLKLLRVLRLRFDHFSISQRLVAGRHASNRREAGISVFLFVVNTRSRINFRRPLNRRLVGGRFFAYDSFRLSQRLLFRLRLGFVGQHNHRFLLKHIHGFFLERSHSHFLGDGFFLGHCNVIKRFHIRRLLLGLFVHCELTLGHDPGLGLGSSLGLNLSNRFVFFIAFSCGLIITHSQ
mmetsp:Transcript_28312/g.71011  ORF Transcript_28312/g.71011 Transcript_28312/m.71011 type:complete len:560 (+) Transcript_28312:516-2195(+)